MAINTKNKKITFDNFSKELEEASNNVQLKIASSTTRKGKGKIRDVIVFWKVFWQEALSFLAPVQSAVIFTALIPASVVTVNAALTWAGVSFQFPLDIASMGAIIFIIGILIFGRLAVRNIGTLKTASELGAKMNPVNYLIWAKLVEMEEKIDNIEKEK